MLNEGQFAGTGGWVLKPEGYRSKGPDTQRLQAPVVANQEISVRIEVFAAQDLPVKDDSSRFDRLHP